MLVRVVGKRWKNVVFGLRGVVSALRSVWSQIEAIIIIIDVNLRLLLSVLHKRVLARVSERLRLEALLLREIIAGKGGGLFRTEIRTQE